MAEAAVIPALHTGRMLPSPRSALPMPSTPSPAISPPREVALLSGSVAYPQWQHDLLCGTEAQSRLTPSTSSMQLPPTLRASGSGPQVIIPSVSDSPMLSRHLDPGSYLASSTPFHWKFSICSLWGSAKANGPKGTRKMWWIFQVWVQRGRHKILTYKERSGS